MNSITPPLRIEPLSSLAAFKAIQEVQRKAWNLSPGDDIHVIPTNMLMAIALAGGSVMLGCYDATDTLIGYVYSFMGQVEGPTGQPVLRQWSHQMAVLPDARRFGIGKMLKLAQREATLALGMELMSWTYDPLEAVNARLNIGRLRTVARRYRPNLYGDLGGINIGLPTDRFEVEWWLRSPRVLAALAGEPLLRDPEPLLAASRSATGLVAPSEANLPFGLPRFVIEVPASFQRIKRDDHGLAIAWRMQTRDWFERAFAAGYLVSDAWADGEGEAQRAFYEVSQADDPALL